MSRILKLVHGVVGAPHCPTSPTFSRTSGRRQSFGSLITWISTSAHFHSRKLRRLHTDTLKSAGASYSKACPVSLLRTTMSDYPPPQDGISPSPPAVDVDAETDTPDRAESPDLLLTMSASVVLADLPRDASAALASAGGFAVDKVVIKFKPVGSAPALAQDVCKISAARKFEEVVRYLRRKLRCKNSDSVFLYVNSAFAPSLDEVVGNLHQVCPNSLDRHPCAKREMSQCFKNSHGQLIVAYSITPAFG